MLPQYPEHYILMKNIFSWKQTEQISNPKNFFFPWILKKMLIPALLMIFSGKWLQSFIKKFQKHFHGWRSAVSKQSSGTAFYLLTCASSSILRIKWFFCVENHFPELKLSLFVFHITGFIGILHLSLDASDHYLLVTWVNRVPQIGDNLMNFWFKDSGLKLAEKCHHQVSNWLLF